MKARTGYRLFRAVYRDRTGKQCESGKWYVEFRDHLQAVRRLPLFSSKKASAQAAEKLTQLVADVQVNGRVVDPELTRWLGGLPESTLRKLADIGLVEAERLATSQSMSEHLADFKASMLARGVMQKTGNLVTNRVGLIMDRCRFKRLTDVRLGPVLALLADLRAGSGTRRGISQQSSNAYLAAAVQFCRWLVKEHRISENPLAGADKLTVTDGQKRRALTHEEQCWLLAVTRDGPDWEGIGAENRAMLYRFALGSGFRASELRSLRKRDFRVDNGEPVVTLAASATKNRKPADQPITRELADALADFLRFKAPEASMFTMPVDYKTARMLRSDMARARAAWVDAAATPAERKQRLGSDFLVPETHEGRVDFHALRHTFISTLAQSGIHPKEAQALARHSSITLTMDRYTHVPRNRLSVALSSLPTLTEPAAQAARRTGTDNAPVCLASCLLETGASDQTSLDSNGRGSSDKRSMKAAGHKTDGSAYRCGTGLATGFRRSYPRIRRG